MINFYKDNGYYIFHNSIDKQLLDDSNNYLDTQENLDLWDSQLKLKPNNILINRFLNLNVTKKILNETVNNNYTVLADWFLVKRSFLITHRDAVFFPYHHKDVSVPIKHKLWLSEEFSYKYLNIIFYLTDEKPGFEYFNVPKSHILDFKKYEQYFTACSYYKQGDIIPTIISKDDAIKYNIKASFTNCSLEEYKTYDALQKDNERNFSFYNVKKGDVLLQSGSILHGSYGAKEKSVVKNSELRKCFILRLISNDYFNLT
jgi:hypothetical protein